MHHRHASALFCLCLTGLLSGCGFIAAPFAGTATSAAQLSVKGADKGIDYSKQAAEAGIHYRKVAATTTVEIGKGAVGGVAAAASNVADAAGSALEGLRPATSEEAKALHDRFSDR